MSKTYLILVSDNSETVETAKKYWETHDVEFQVYTPEQWRTSLENPTFRQQLGANLPTLSAGMGSLTPSYNTNNVLPFPTPSVDSKVQKMDDIEAKAIENAISQYKGNLTEAAKALGIGRATLYRKVKQYQIDPSQARKKKVAQAA
jgi:DNA-binding NtrC family response regulator